MGQVADQHLSLKVHHPWQCFLFVFYVQDALLKLVYWKDLAVSVHSGIQKVPNCSYPRNEQESHEHHEQSMGCLWDGM